MEDNIILIDSHNPVKRGSFVTYHDPVVKAPCVINIQDWYKDTRDGMPVTKYVYYKAYNLVTSHLYYDGSRLAIVLDDYPDARFSTDREIALYLEGLRKEGLTL